MRRSVVRPVPLLVATLVLARAAAARADDPQIVSVDGTSWSSLIEEIQDDPTTDGRTFAVEVIAGGATIACGDYTLALDDVGARAFHVEGCDAANQATTLRLVDRAALFEPGELVPRARRTRITASIVERVHEDGGGTAPRASSELWCTVALAPTLWDGLHGRRVALTPDRFDVRTPGAGVDVAADGDGWTAHGQASASLEFTYEVVERATGEVVLTSEATLSCADAPTVTAPRAATSTTSPPLGELDMGFDGIPFSAPTYLARDAASIPVMDGSTSQPRTGKLTYWGTTAGYGMRFGWFTFAMRYTIAYGDAGMAGVWTLAMGATHRYGRVALYAAPAVRISMLSVPGVIGPDVEIDPAALVGGRVRLGAGRWSFMADALAPVRDSTQWQLTAGFDYDWNLP